MKQQALTRTAPAGKPARKPNRSLRFATINHAVDNHLASMSGTEAKLYMALWRHERDGVVGLSHEQLAGICGVDRSTVIRNLKPLTDHGLVRVVERGSSKTNTPNKYQLRGAT